MYVCMCACMYLCMYECVHVCMCACMHAGLFCKEILFTKKYSQSETLIGVGTNSPKIAYVHIKIFKNFLPWQKVPVRRTGAYCHKKSPVCVYVCVHVCVCTCMYESRYECLFK